MIEVELPDGSIAEFPEGTSPDIIKGALAKKFPSPSVGGDILKSGASGVARGAADLIGLPGTIGDAVEGGLNWAMRKGYETVTGSQPSPQGGMLERLFAGPTPEVQNIRIGGGSNPLSGQNLREGIANLTGGATDYQPQTTAGEYARTLGEFAPAAATAPGSLATKALMATVPALSSETAGQATRGTSIEPYARGAAALATGLPIALRGGNTIKQAAKGAPTREALKAQTDQLYSTLRNAGIKYDANAFAKTVQSATDDLLKEGMRPSVAKEAFGLLDDLSKEVGRSPDFNDINSLVQMVGEAARGATRQGNNPLAKAFYMIRDKLDDFERTAPLITNKNISRDKLNMVRSLARQTALKNIKARRLEQILEDAQTYRSGFESGVRNQIGNLVRSKSGKQLFSGAERTALLQVAQGRKPLEQLAKFGLDMSKFNGNAAFIPTLTGVGLGAAVDPVLGGGVVAAGTAAKQLSPRLTQKAFNTASAAIRSGKLNDPQFMNAANLLKGDARLRALLLGNAAISPQAR